MTIEERLENLERETGRLKRRNRWLLGAILLVAGGLVFPLFFETTASRARAQAEGTAKEIRAKRIVVEDENGKSRIMLSAGNNSPMMSLADEDGNSRITLFWSKISTGLMIYGENYKNLASLSAIKVGAGLAAGLVVCDENGNPRIRLNAFKDGPKLTILDENGKDRFAAGNAQTETPDGKTITYPESSLILFGPDGKVIWSAIK
jgi:hypothetical protein